MFVQFNCSYVKGWLGFPLANRWVLISRTDGHRQGPQQLLVCHSGVCSPACFLNICQQLTENAKKMLEQNRMFSLYPLPTPPPPPSLVDTYYLHPPDARAIFLHIDLLYNVKQLKRAL